MSTRIQVIFTQQELLEFRSKAKAESKSLSAWLREAARYYLKQQQEKSSLKSSQALKSFFRECDKYEKGSEDDWDTIKKNILRSARRGGIL